MNYKNIIKIKYEESKANEIKIQEILKEIIGKLKTLKTKLFFPRFQKF